MRTAVRFSAMVDNCYIIFGPGGTLVAGLIGTELVKGYDAVLSRVQAVIGLLDYWKMLLDTICRKTPG